MQDFKYFTYGYHHNNPRFPLYGLYQPILNCFLIILPDYDEIGLPLMALLSSRYLLQPVYVSGAENYEHNIIDNLVCDKWSISNTKDIFVRGLTKNVKVIAAEQLIPAVPQVRWDIEKEKQWAMFCVFWLRIIRRESYSSGCGFWIDQELGNLPVFDKSTALMDPVINAFLTKVMELLYLGSDLDQAEQAIADLINQNSVLQNRYLDALKVLNE